MSGSILRLACDIFTVPWMLSSSSSSNKAPTLILSLLLEAFALLAVWSTSSYIPIRPHVHTVKVFILPNRVVRLVYYIRAFSSASLALHAINLSSIRTFATHCCLSPISSPAKRRKLFLTHLPDPDWTAPNTCCKKLPYLHHLLT